MDNVRIHGKPPLLVAMAHGGPGAAGEMAQIAKNLSTRCGVVEPLQTEVTLDGQVEELRTVLEKNCRTPVTLVGFSWGAWLSFILTANYPSLVKKLILIGSGPFEEHYAANINETILNRLSLEERTEAKEQMKLLGDPSPQKAGAAFKRFGELFSKADAYDPIPRDQEDLDLRVDIFRRVWKDAALLRRSGKLLNLGKQIRCPVVAIHGDYDPHPAQGVEEPLTAVLINFRFILLKNCGHKPWIEKEAKDPFYKILDEELS